LYSVITKPDKIATLHTTQVRKCDATLGKAGQKITPQRVLDTQSTQKEENEKKYYNDFYRTKASFV
jgi:hypothetical protein